MRSDLRCGILVMLLPLLGPGVASGATRLEARATPGENAPRGGSDFHPGAPGVGDLYYPEYGNGGYDVQHYDLAVRYAPVRHHLRGVATIQAIATENLDSFNLDLVGLTVRSIDVNGTRANWTRTAHELTVRPWHALRAQSPFRVIVRYDGVPTTFVLPGTNLPMGFVKTDDGALIAGEPESAAGWFPVNDHPTDRATYRFRITVPRGYGVVANGLPRGERSAGGWTTFIWEARDPMASYLATFDVGQWSIRDSTTASGLRVIDAVDADLGDIADEALARQPEILGVFEEAFGPYPFETAGAIVDDLEELGFALETQTRPVYPGWIFAFGPEAGAEILAHELAHQWYGDSVAVGRWQDIWLNEGFATYAEFLWLEHDGVGPVDAILAYVYDVIPPDDPFWNVVVGDPGVAYLFSEAVYYRGAMTLSALRNAVGEPTFWEILRRWAADRALGTGTTPEFVALAEELSGQPLDELFETWLFTPGKPAVFPPVQQAAPGAPGSLSKESIGRIERSRARGGALHRR